jgi:hypothetical protein
MQNIYPIETYAIVGFWCSIIATIFLWLAVKKRRALILQAGAFLLFLIFLGLFAASTAHADENNWKIDATLTSFHLAAIPNGVEKFNSENYGVIVEYHFPESEFYVQGGIYQNSFYETCEIQYRHLCDDLSHFIGGGVVMLEDTDIRVGVELGFADGYDVLKFPKIGDDIAVMGGLTVAMETFDNQAVKVLFTYPIIGLMYQYGFN